MGKDKEREEVRKAVADKPEGAMRLIGYTIALIVCDVFKVSVSDVLGRTKRWAAKEAMHAMRRIMYASGYTYQRIARIVERDHGAIIKSCRRCDALRSVDPEYDAKLRACARIIGASLD